jgi:hypothetical protein
MIKTTDHGIQRKEDGKEFYVTSVELWQFIPVPAVQEAKEPGKFRTREIERIIREDLEDNTIKIEFEWATRRYPPANFIGYKAMEKQLADITAENIRMAQTIGVQNHELHDIHDHPLRHLFQMIKLKLVALKWK